MIEPHVIQLNQDGSLSLTHQRIFPNTAKEYESKLDERDRKLIQLLEKIEQGQLIKRFYEKSIRPVHYFAEVFDEEQYQRIRPWIEEIINEALGLLGGKALYIMSKEGYPAERKLTMATQPCSVLFHFRRNEHQVRYFPTLKYQGERIEFMYKDAQIIVNQPALLLLNDTLHHFQQDLDGKKLSPFLNQRFIAVPRASEENYFRRFVVPLIERYPVYAQGFDIKTLQFTATPAIKLSGSPAGEQRLALFFRYGPYLFPGRASEPVTVEMEHQTGTDHYIFYRVKRSMSWEQKQQQLLLSWGDYRALSGLEALDWLSEHHLKLQQNGVEVLQEEGSEQYTFESVGVNFEVTEENDWFDIKALVHFGSYSLPFYQLRDHILNHEREFVLPSGQVALIPESWFSQFNTLFQFSSKKDRIVLKRQHLGLLSELQESKVAGLNMERKIGQLSGFQGIDEVSVPAGFLAQLRPYQKAGYDWFQFLKKYGFGGCLADDMGLGKTVQTLALLQYEAEHTPAQERRTSLIIMPTSLIYNWIEEAARFAPALRILNHTGAFRAKAADEFAGYDLVLCTYGIARMDQELLQDFFFHYIVLDESQHIKNPSSKSFKAIKQLQARHRLILTGTPVENTIADLWTQMEFLNPGLLGGLSSFTRNFVLPIERKKDPVQSARLQALVKPFILRRTKAQVASELPEKSEQVFYCTLSPQQAEYYERVKSEFRNEILEQQVSSGGYSGIQVLQGIGKLRQLANHPLMVDADYDGDSGKFTSVIKQLRGILSRGHKVLIFSSFVRQMQLYKAYLEDHHIDFAYLDGSTTDRAAQVDKFRSSPEVQVFLISIKAGGVGLNLIEADYVFILDPWWNPAVEMQAVDRAHRIGQTQKVFIYKFISKDTVEEKILALQQKKKNISQEIIQVEESFIKSLSPQDIDSLLA